MNTEEKNRIIKIISRMNASTPEGMTAFSIADRMLNERGYTWGQFYNLVSTSQRYDTHTSPRTNTSPFQSSPFQRSKVAPQSGRLGVFCFTASLTNPVILPLGNASAKLVCTVSHPNTNETWENVVSTDLYLIRLVERSMRRNETPPFNIRIEIHATAAIITASSVRP